jgi:predicted MFS family arabinose efflux permease
MKIRAILVFFAFATAYFMSAALRTVTATLAPTLTAEFALQARDLGLLSGGYFLGFAMLQIQLGGWLDRFGPKRVILVMLSIAVVGCLVFRNASTFHGLLLARFLSGLGVSVCLMAPLTAYRRWFNPETQLRANSWMLMSGSLGMLASTLPVQAALPVLGWRGIFGVLAGLVALAMVLIAILVPKWEIQTSNTQQATPEPIWTHPYFARMVPIGFFIYGGMIAIQTLWAGPWMTRVAGYTAEQAAGGLFAINFAMLLNYWAWGWLNPKLSARGWDAVRLIKLGLPISLVALPLAAFVATDSSWLGVVSIPIWLVWIVYFVTSSFVSLAQPAVGMAFPSHMAGRALTAYNLVIFLGVFTMQWGIGLGIDLFLWLGLEQVQAFQSAIAVFWLLCAGSFVHFYRAKS